MEKHHPHQTSTHRPPLFENAYGNVGVHPLVVHDGGPPLLHRRPSPSTDSCCTTTTLSHSVVDSRRNSTDNSLVVDDEVSSSGLCSVFDKLKMDEFTERRNSSPTAASKHHYPLAISKTASSAAPIGYRSMSVDVGSVQQQHKMYQQQMQHQQYRHMMDTPTPSNYISSSSSNGHLLFSDEDPHLYKQQPDMLPTTPQVAGSNNTNGRNDHPYYLRHYAGSTDKLSSLVHHNGLFPSSSSFDLTSSFRRTSASSARQNKSVESLRSKSWAQYLENASSFSPPPMSSSSPPPPSTAAEEEESLPNARAQAAFYGQPRQFSYGWPPEAGNGKSDYLPANIKFKNNHRVTASHSYSDLHGVAHHASAAAAVHGAAVSYGVRILEDPLVHLHNHHHLHTDSPPPGMPYPSSSPSYPMLHNLAGTTTTTTTTATTTTPAATLHPPQPPIPQQHPHQQRPTTPVLQQQQQRRASPSGLSSAEDPNNTNRFATANLEDFAGKLYELCKDQNGCRFLQKKLEEPDPRHLELIFQEVEPHFVELMTEPFGNYLCQKLIEHCDDRQRDILVDTVAPDLLKISLNMHGTRAVQRLIEFLSTPHQIHTVTRALKPNVVALIKDLNGNHVIQKCLHRLSVEHKQFVYDAVSENCMQVASHRHGCCVLQRCIDYASQAQKDQLAQVITWHALPLVQDPFGNYVVQYVLDLGDIAYTDTLVRCFLEHMCDLSVQKFSSNVVEKCVRVAEPETRRLLIAELMNETSIEKLLRDSFANYVVQTCLEYADPDQRAQLVELIRPLLPSIRSTPYGKRINSKIQREQGRQQQQHQHQQRHRVLRQHQSFSSLRSYSGSNSNMYHQDNDSGNALVFGLPLIGGDTDTLYPYH